jgi:hypothetical protein
MANHPDEPPRYTRYRARPRLPHHKYESKVQPERLTGAGAGGRQNGRRGGRSGNGRGDVGGRGTSSRAGWRRWARPKRIALSLAGLVVAWLLLSLVLFLISSHLERTPLPTNVASVLNPAGNPLTSANNILVLGSDRRQKNSKEPGAETTGYGRSDTIMLIRTGGGHAARLSIPRDTVIEIPEHGLEKINAAHEYGGPAESVSVIKHWLGIPINHVVEVNFENFPQLIDAMGGVTYTGGCITSNLDGGSGAHAREPVRTRRDGHPARGTPAGAIHRHEEPAGVAVELLQAAVDRVERASGDHLRHEQRRTARHVRLAVHHRHAAHTRAQAHRPDHASQRRRRPHDLRRSPQSRRGQIHGRLTRGTALASHDERSTPPKSPPNRRYTEFARASLANSS